MESLKELYKIGFGPSSSHTMGPEKCARLMKKLNPDAEEYKVFLYGSLALTGKGHLTDVILKRVFHPKKVEIIFDINSKFNHPNTLKIEALKSNEVIDEKIFVSIGGGSIKIEGQELIKKENVYSFNNFESIKKYCLENNLSLADFVYKFEGESIKEYLKEVYDVMTSSIKRGLEAEGVLPGKLEVQRKAKMIYSQRDNNPVSIISSYAYAVSEENAAGEQIVTAPTCGASGVLPAVLKYYQEVKKCHLDKIIDALAVASVIGNVIKENACISGALAGCQSEIGSACAMASGASAFLEGYSIEVIECASEIALEHHLGLTCDPIAGLVQIPCIERNAIASLRAIESAKLAVILATSRKISLDTVIDTMFQTGKDLNQAYKETSLGGLAKFYHEDKSK